MTPFTPAGSAELIVTGFLFGFGFAIGQALWAALVALANRRKE